MPLFHFEHGNHICVFYQHPVDLVSTLAPFVLEGIRKRERCVCIEPPNVLKILIYKLQFLGVDTLRAIDSGMLEFHDPKRAYLPDGRFEANRIRSVIERQVVRAADEGFKGLRAAGDLSWSGERCDAHGEIIRYENDLQAYCDGKPVTLLCQYQIPQLNAATLDLILHAHQFSITDTGVGSTYKNLHIRQGQYGIDIVGNSLSSGAGFDFIVQSNAGNIVGWGSGDSMEAARGSARTVLSMTKNRM